MSEMKKYNKTEEERILILAKKIEQKRLIQSKYNLCYSKLVELERRLKIGGSNGPKELSGSIGISIGTLEPKARGCSGGHQDRVQCSLPVESGNYLISLLIAHAKKEIES